MSDSYYFVWLISTGQIPQLLAIIIFIAFIVGLFVRNFKNF